MDDFKGSKAFLMIPPAISRDKDLLKKPKSILLMGEIISMLNVTGNFHMSNKTIAEILDVTPQAVANYLNLLEEKKLIRREKITVPAKNKNSQRIVGRKIFAGPNLVNASLLGWSTGVDKGSQQELMGVVNGRLHKENNIKEHKNRSFNSSSGEEEEETKRKEIYQSFFKSVRSHDYEHKFCNPTPSELRQLNSLMSKIDLDSLKILVTEFNTRLQAGLINLPWSYLLKLMRDTLTADKNWNNK